MSGDQSPGGGQANGPGEQPRGVTFHWLANMVLASIALFAGALFGERIPREQMSTAFIAVAAIALALVPVTRYWERTGIEGRRKAADRSREDKDEENLPGPHDKPEEPSPPAGDGQL